MTTIDRTAETFLGSAHLVGAHVRARVFAIGGVAVWLLTAAVIGIMMVADPAAHSVLCIYFDATAAWWSRLDLYVAGDGYAYLPHFAVLFTPFQAAGAPWGNLAWMLVSVGWLGVALWHLMRWIDPSRAGRFFFMATLLALPLCGGAIRNGQANVLFAAATVHAVVLLFRARWSAAAAMMLVGVAIKPLGIVMVLLAPAVYRKMRMRLAIACAAFLLAPFLVGPPAYVAGQYVEFLADIINATGVVEHRFANIAGILRSIGVNLSGPPATAVSLAGAAVALVAWINGARRVNALQRGLLLLALSTTYLMLFNPMTESNGYVIVAPAMAAWAILLLESDRRTAGWVLVGVMLAIGLLPEPMRAIAPNLSLWAKPLGAMVFVVIALGGRGCQLPAISCRQREGHHASRRPLLLADS